jgi:uncharacterized protein with FMN-binding domain
MGPDRAAQAPAPSAENKAPPPQDPAPAPNMTIAREAPAPVHYADGTFSGYGWSYWGDVELALTLQGGVITKVELQTMPDHRRRSAEISDWAGPQLVQEAIQAQKANVDIITAATNTTTAFRQALDSALARSARQ